MTPEKLLSILSKAAELKTTTRHCFTSEDRMELLEEMGQLNTLEAKTYKALDKLEAVISHNETEISTWLPLEYELQFTYGKENVQFSQYLKSLSRCIDECTRRKIDTEG